MPEDWWRRAFAVDYVSVYAHRDDAAAEREVAGVLPMVAGRSPVLDACCGGGRHLAALRRAGVDAVGFDFSADLLATTRGRDEARGRVGRADLRALPFADGAFAAALLFFTSFGYFDDAANAAVLADLARILTPDGRLMLDLPDPTIIRNRLVPESGRTLDDGRRLRERRSFDGTRVRKEVILLGADGAELDRYHEDVRIYGTGELVGLADRTGLVHLETWPGLLGPAEPGDRQVHWFERR